MPNFLSRILTSFLALAVMAFGAARFLPSDGVPEKGARPIHPKSCSKISSSSDLNPAARRSVAKDTAPSPLLSDNPIREIQSFMPVGTIRLWALDALAIGNLRVAKGRSPPGFVSKGQVVEQT